MLYVPFRWSLKSDVINLNSKSPVSGERICFGFSAPVLNEPRAYCLRPAFQYMHSCQSLRPNLKFIQVMRQPFAPIESHRRESSCIDEMVARLDSVSHQPRGRSEKRGWQDLFSPEMSVMQHRSAKGAVREARLAGSFLAGDESHATHKSPPRHSHLVFPSS